LAIRIIVEEAPMSFACKWEQRPNTFGLEGRVAVLGDANNRLEVWPALGFNAFRWQVAGQELLYASPALFTERRPTRTGVPILFPFPNRIRAGRFDWQAKSYSLPTNDSTKKNAIHGFVCQRPWRVIDQGVNAESAWITGEFHGSVDAPETLPLWPADYRLRVTYRLFDHMVRIEAEADNPDTKPLPFGLGYHPYFAIAPFGGENAVVSTWAHRLWELADNLPTGKIIDIDQPRDLRTGKPISALHLDDVMTGLKPLAFDEEDHLGLAGVLQNPVGTRMLTLWIGADFRELVLFTPPHREAFCIEPYTCTTDAINLSPRGIDGGWRMLQPGEHWRGDVEVHFRA
jgi:aldose 1-epimerase